MGGYDLAQYLLNEWKGKDNKLHRGFIDTNDTYMSLRQDDYIGNADNLRMFNFKRDKNQAYERAQSVINQGLVRWPKSLNVRNEYELEIENPDGTMEIKHEKVTFDELNALTQIELMKQEIVAMQKVKRPNGTVVFETSPDGKARRIKDDRADVVAMLCDRLMELRIEDALQLEEKPKEGFKEMFGKMGVHKGGANSSNPFANRGTNPFLNKQRPN